MFQQMKVWAKRLLLNNAHTIQCHTSATLYWLQVSQRTNLQGQSLHNGVNSDMLDSLEDQLGWVTFMVEIECSRFVEIQVFIRESSINGSQTVLSRKPTLSPPVLNNVWKKYWD